ncbi:hypothetical protein [Mucilaginibacter gotjawali]|uniref:Uncharacterized protein n=2 Tax=Mucilaginibacter gotjawali TaxID=1550579 RepID=A0A0X8X2X6_9SPHI|nr:hypothetical protein [Mucilaginibacter gotjawali]MBB3053904.1 hypothetical protein [Mucilaginibacter gotjawali]BAU54168.1 hypothetical protein MgSA37_02340 [Mucilaginibacter gotjawali]
MKNLKIGFYLLMLVALASCSKKDKVVVSKPLYQVGKAVSSSAPLSGSIKGTMIANTTYTISGDVTVNAGDTLLIQQGVNIKISNGANFIVKGILLSIGTKTSPITITDPTKNKTTGASSAATDPAYVGGWGGIYCDVTCPLLVIKWTHLDFGGAGLLAPPFTGPSTGDQYIVYWQNPHGSFIMEDSWIYGSPDDAIRFYGGTVNIMRNTLEKCGGTGGDGFNAKGGTQGNMAYNLIIGGATNGTKSANDPGTQAQQTEIAMFNNTYVNGGFRNTGTYGARSGSIEVENNSRALAYNNLIVDCNFGVRIAGGNNVTAKVYLADTLSHSDGPIKKTAYGYNFYYVDNVATADQIIPTNIAQAVVTHPTNNGIPNMATFLGATYTFGFAYDGTSLVGKNNPMFANYPLPNANFATQASVDGFDFHLKSGSPAIGIGYTGFSPITQTVYGTIPVDPIFGSSGITGPGKDAGCYQSDGTGNQH